MSEVKGQCHILYPVSNRCTFFFVSYQSDQPFLRYGKIVWPWKTHPKVKKNAKITVFNKTAPKSHQIMTMTRAIKLPCFVVMSSSHFIAQTRKFMLIDATDGTLGQGHGKVIQYISQDPYILCAKYLSFSWNGLDVRGKSCCGRGGGGRGGGSGGNELKT